MKKEEDNWDSKKISSSLLFFKDLMIYVSFIINYGVFCLQDCVWHT